MAIDTVYSTIKGMRTLPAGKFKQICLRVLNEVRDTGEVVVITKRGVPVAQLTPVPRSKDSDWSGAMRGTGTIVGDLIEPALAPDDWQAEGG